MRRFFLLPAMLLAACMQKPAASDAAAADTAVEADGEACLAGEGRLEAQLRGALQADLDWRAGQMQCDGDLRPDGSGLRISLAGPLDATRRLRFIFGIDLQDTASGPAQVLPTNLTVLVEAEATLFATRGADKCAVEDLERTLLEPGLERVSVRGYCLGPASDLAGEQRVLVPVAGLIDVAAELARLDKEIVRVRAEIGKCENKLGSDSFVARAPVAVVEQERARLADWQGQLAGLAAQRARLAG